MRHEPVKRRPRLTESRFGIKTSLHCQDTDTRIPTCSEERVQHNSLYEHLCLIEEARASIKATSTYDAVLYKTQEVLTTIHEDNVRILGENDNLRMATGNLALQVSRLEGEKIKLQDRMTDLVAAESLFDHRVREKEAQLEEQREYRRLTEVERDRAQTLALELRDKVQVV